jgi:hypothetical protein
MVPASDLDGSHNSRGDLCALGRPSSRRGRGPPSIPHSSANHNSMVVCSCQARNSSKKALRSSRSGRTKPLDPRYDLRNNSPTGFAWGYNGSGPAQLALAILTDYFGAKPGGKALAEALYDSFKFAALPKCWKMNFEEVGIAPAAR